jgi:hypothetical protein
VVWSKNSIASRNVRHEATIATDEGKLISVLIDDLSAKEFPIGHYTFQTPLLSHWTGDQNDDTWLKVRREVEARLMPLWAKHSIDRVEAELYAEQARREAAERRHRTLREQIEKEARAQADLKHERERALEDIAAVKDQLSTAVRERDRALEEIAAVKEQLSTAARERDRALHEFAALKEQVASSTSPEPTHQQSPGPTEPPKEQVASSTSPEPTRQESPGPTEPPKARPFLRWLFDG